MVTLGVLVALDDLFLGDLLEAALGLNTLEVFDRLSARLMDHAESDCAFSRSLGTWILYGPNKMASCTFVSWALPQE